eukprot:4444887-Pyramimonas_sp.AAC.1
MAPRGSTIGQSGPRGPHDGPRGPRYCPKRAQYCPSLFKRPQHPQGFLNHCPRGQQCWHQGAPKSAPREPEGAPRARQE